MVVEGLVHHVTNARAARAWVLVSTCARGIPMFLQLESLEEKNTRRDFRKAVDQEISKERANLHVTCCGCFL